MLSSSRFVVPIATLFSTEPSIENNIWLHEVNEWNMSTRKTHIKSKKLFLTSWTLLGLSKRVNGNSPKILVIFDFESNCVQEETFRETNITTRIEKLVSRPVSILSNLVEEKIFLCNFDPHHLVASFVGTLKNLASQNMAKIENLFLDIRTTKIFKLGSILEKLTQRHNRWEQVKRYDMNREDCENEDCASTQFLHIEKERLIDLQEHLERYCNVSPVFFFNSAKYDRNLIKSYWLPILVNERDIEPTVIKNENQFKSFEFVVIQLMDIMNFHGGATSLDSFSKEYKTSETKRFLPYGCGWFDHPDKQQNRELPPCDASYSKLRSCNLLDVEYTDYFNLLRSGLTTEQASVKLKLSKPPPNGIEKYQYLQQIWKQEQMSSFKQFLRWYIKKVAVPTLEAMHKMTAYYHGKKIDVLKLGCTLPNLANICLHKSTDGNFYPFTEGDEDLLQKNQEDVVGCPFLAFTLKIFVDETFIRKCTNIFKTIVGTDIGQFYIHIRCVKQCRPVFIRVQNFDSETGRFTPWQNKTRSFEKLVMSYFQRTRPECKNENFFTTGRQKKNDCFSVDGFVLTATLCFRPWISFITSVPVKK